MKRIGIALLIVLACAGCATHRSHDARSKGIVGVAPQLPAIRWWSASTKVEFFTIEKQPVDGGAWSFAAKLPVADVCKLVNVNINGFDRDRLFCRWEPPTGVPRGVYFRISAAGRVVTLPQLALTCVNGLPAGASIGGAASIWPLDAVAAKGCP